jgi:hypothetical protein
MLCNSQLSVQDNVQYFVLTSLKNGTANSYRYETMKTSFLVPNTLHVTVSQQTKTFLVTYFCHLIYNLCLKQLNFFILKPHKYWVRN